MPTSVIARMGTFEVFAKTLVEIDRSKTTDEVLSAAMDAVMREECDDEAKWTFLRQAIEDGEASGLYQCNAFASLRREISWESVV